MYTGHAKYPACKIFFFLKQKNKEVKAPLTKKNTREHLETGRKDKYLGGKKKVAKCTMEGRGGGFKPIVSRYSGD